MQQPEVSAHAQAPAVKQADVCSICQERIGHCRVRCNQFFHDGSPVHMFHRRCLLRWLREGESQTCPVCRAPIKHDHPERKCLFKRNLVFDGGVIEVRGMLASSAMRTRAAQRWLINEAVTIARQTQSFPVDAPFRVEEPVDEE